MKKFVILICTALTLSFVAGSCSSDNSLPNCQKDEHALITEVDNEANTVVVRQDLSMAIKFQIANSCGVLKKLEVVKNGFDWEVKAITHYDGCDCNEVVEIKTEPFIFRATETGTYTIKFLNPNGEMISKTVTVTPS